MCSINISNGRTEEKRNTEQRKQSEKNIEKQMNFKHNY